MYIATVPNRNSPPAILLRESFREDGKVKNRTLANLSDWPTENVAAPAGPLLAARDGELGDAADRRVPGGRAGQPHRRSSAARAPLLRSAPYHHRHVGRYGGAAGHRRLPGLRAEPLRPAGAARGGAPPAGEGGQARLGPLRQLRLARPAGAGQARRVVAAGRPHLVGARALGERG